MIITITFKPVVASNIGNDFTNTQQQFTPECYKFHAKKWKDVKCALKTISAIKNRGRVDVEDATKAISTMTTVQVCDYLKISERTCRRWRAKGRLPFIKMGRVVIFDRNDVDHALQTQETNLTRGIEQIKK